MAAHPGVTCIIGAGTSGIAAAKALKEKNLPFDWYASIDWGQGDQNQRGMEVWEFYTI